jgi:predicted transcriptional regulator with HTH domain
MSQPLRLVVINGMLTGEDGAARHNDPDTSYIAAATVNRRQLEMAVYTYLFSIWPRDLTALEISRSMGRAPRSITPRMRPLFRLGLVDQVTKRYCVNDDGNPTLQMTWAAIRV